MHVGYGVAFQNPDNALSDAEVYHHEVRMAEMAEPLGFDSVWSVEHHFDDCTMCPDVLQFLTYVGGRTRHAKRGSMVVVLPGMTRFVSRSRSRCSTISPMAA